MIGKRNKWDLKQFNSLGRKVKERHVEVQGKSVRRRRRNRDEEKQAAVLQMTERNNKKSSVEIKEKRMRWKIMRRRSKEGE